MAVNFFVQIAIAIALSLISALLTPQPKTAKGQAAKDLENPTAEAGRPIPVVFGTVTVKGGNILWFGDKSIQTVKVRA